MFDLILMFLNSLFVGFRSQAALQAEIIALRHQLIVLQRTQKPAAHPQSRRSMPLGVAVTSLVGLAFFSLLGQAGNRDRMASPGLPLVLVMEDSSRSSG